MFTDISPSKTSALDLTVGAICRDLALVHRMVCKKNSTLMRSIEQHTNERNSKRLLTEIKDQIARLPADARLTAEHVLQDTVQRALLNYQQALESFEV